MQTIFLNKIALGITDYPYEVIRVQAATYYDYDVNPYTNSLILNNKVFVPQTGSALDDDAILVYETAMPGYEIIGVFSNSWINSDALHCRTHGIADREMLYIKHIPFHGLLPFQENFIVSADISSYGGSNLSAGFPKLFYKQNEDNWIETTMTNTENSTYSAMIPGLSGDNEVEYYISASNENGKSEMNPRIGSFDPHKFSYSDNSEIKKSQKANPIIIFPNPNNGVFSIQTKYNSGTIQIYNINGQEVFYKNINCNKSTINISSFKSGIYLVKIKTANSLFYKNLIIHN